MRVLVAFASAHGSTEGIGRALSDRLTTRGLDVVSGSVTDLQVRGTSFSVGPVGELRRLVDCRDHRYFAGAVQKGHGGRLGDLFMMLTGGRHGDVRDWADIDRWADHIADHIADQLDG